MTRNKGSPKGKPQRHAELTPKGQQQSAGRRPPAPGIQHSLFRYAASPFLLGFPRGSPPMGP